MSALTRDSVADRSGQTCSYRTAEGQRPQGAFPWLPVGSDEGGQQLEAQGRPARPWGGLKGRQAGHTDCSTNGRITGIVTPTQPP